MPQQYHPTGQDWSTVNVGTGSSLNKGASVPKTARELTLAKAAGLVSTEKRHGAGSNKSAHAAGGATVSARKLEEADDVGTIAKVDKDLSKAIMQGRTAKKMTQKELATAINEKTQVVADYESGRAVPNGQIISRIEQKLGVKLPRPGSKPKPAASSSNASGGTGTKKGPLPAKVAALTRGGPPKRR